MGFEFEEEEVEVEGMNSRLEEVGRVREGESGVRVWQILKR